MTTETASKTIKIHMEPIPVYQPKVINKRFKNKNRINDKIFLIANSNLDAILGSRFAC